MVRAAPSLIGSPHTVMMTFPRALSRFNPAEEINPTAVQAMAEVGIDISEQYPKPWTSETSGAANVVVTMGCGDACPVIPGKR